MKHLLTIMAVLFCLNAQAQTFNPAVYRPAVITNNCISYRSVFTSFSDTAVDMPMDTLACFRDTLPVLMLCTAKNNSGPTKNVWAKEGFRLYYGKKEIFTNHKFEPLPIYIKVWMYDRRD